MKKQSTEAFDSLTPKIRAALCAANPDQSDRLWVAGILQVIPPRYHGRILKGYAENHQAQGRRLGNLAILEIGEQFRHPYISPSATDSEIREGATHAANKAFALTTLHRKEPDTRRALLQLADRYQIDPPKHENFGKFINRMTSPHWWRRKLRRQFQKAEAAFIRMGFVHRRAAVYLSDEAYQRFENQQRNTIRLLENLEALNPETGECFPMSELAEHSLSNPANRRAEVMTRVNGMEAYADENGYKGLFITLTCPSRMHPRHSSGQANARFDGTTPKRAQAYLQSKVWEPARKALDRLNIERFGLRVVEPHHDATPHWHLLVFVKAGQEALLLETMRRYALQVDPDEPGAQTHRFQVEPIDKGKGSAASYVAKYISKNLDGKGVKLDHESDGSAAFSAPRAVAWARQHGIRQFQFFGTPSVTVWRELRRLRTLTPELEAVIGAVWQAADSSNFADYMSLQMGQGERLGTLRQEEDSTRYQGETTQRVVGLTLPNPATGQPGHFITRGTRWEIRHKQKIEATDARFCSPWTRVNNCPDVEFKGSPGNSQVNFESPDEIPIHSPCRDEENPEKTRRSHKKIWPPVGTGDQYKGYDR